MRPKFEITADDIEIAVQEFAQLKLNDPEKMAVLREESSCDVQAGPGSGKTTLLMVKLAILARKWGSCDQGLCVLSHTNAARREIEAKLSSSASVHRLLHYPHFVGTIQSFVNEFLALPFLRQRGVYIQSIDDDRHSERAWRVWNGMRTSRFRKANAWLRQGKRDEERRRQIIGTIRYADASLEIESPIIRKLPGPNTDTGAAFRQLKTLLKEDGFFRYDDMFAFAEKALAEVAFVSGALRRRFPFVFVDELQDTSNIQDRLIEHVFAVRDCVLQRLGDENQAIFGFQDDATAAPGVFERRKQLSMSSSHRFGRQIAEFTSTLTAVKKQVLIGDSLRRERRHTVFVYERDAVNLVLPSFGELVLRELNPAEWSTRDVCVVAGRKNEGEHKKDNFPVCLGDYWPGFISDKAAKPAVRDSLLDYLVEARKQATSSKMGGDAVKNVVAGVLGLLRRGGAPEHALPKTRAALMDWLLLEGRLSGFQRFLWRLVRPDQPMNEELWRRSVKELIDILRPFLVDPPATEATDFLAWRETSRAHGEPIDSETPTIRNVYFHRSNGHELPVKFNSIHQVKGQTHAATLVVESYAKSQHDIRIVLPALTGRCHGSALTGFAVEHCKRLFVAMTRPRDLLCLAVFRDHVDDGALRSLDANGWHIEHVRVSS